MSFSSQTLWFCIPTYNDLEAFDILYKRLMDTLDSAKDLEFREVRFILIDDTAGNDKQLNATKLPNNVTVITPPFNLGNQRALVFGLRKMKEKFETRDVVITMDGDGEDIPEDIPKLIAPLAKDEQNFKLISLAHRTRRQESLYFKVLYFFFKILFVSLTGRLIRTGNFAAYRGWTAINTLQHPHFDLCYSSSLVSLDLDVQFVPSPRGIRYAGASKMNFQKLSMHGIRMLMPFLERISIRALIAFTISFALSASLAMVIFYIRFFTEEAIPGWATYTLMLLLIVSILSISQFILLFTMVSQSQGIALSDLESKVD